MSRPVVYKTIIGPSCIHCNMLKWIARRFWSEAPSMKSETAWNMEREEDAWEALTLAVERVAEALEHLVGEK